MLQCKDISMAYFFSLNLKETEVSQARANYQVAWKESQQ